MSIGLSKCDQVAHWKYWQLSWNKWQQRVLWGLWNPWRNLQRGGDQFSSCVKQRMQQRREEEAYTLWCDSKGSVQRLDIMHVGSKARVESMRYSILFWFLVFFIFILVFLALILNFFCFFLVFFLIFFLLFRSADLPVLPLSAQCPDQAGSSHSLWINA